MRILHVFRTPVGGLFRHVRDLTQGLASHGHDVGVICDSTTGGQAAATLLASIEGHASLGIERLPISRLPGIDDLRAARAIAEHAKNLSADIIHCHGAKGGLHGRIAAHMLGLPSIYAPHGGSLHYAWTSPAGAAFLSVEKMLARTGSGLHFVCEYERRAFDAKIGIGGKANAVVHNGLWPGEFTDVPLREGAADLLFIGDMRKLKGVDVFLDALAICKSAHSVTALFAGDGPDLSRFREHADKLGIAEHVEFAGRMAVEEAFSRGDIVVLPSRAESLPYVILEAGAAGRPVIATGVGGIPEILGPESLVPPGDAVALAGRILEFLGDPCTATARAKAFRSRLVNDFSVDSMVNRVLALYQAVLLDRS